VAEDEVSMLSPHSRKLFSETLLSLSDNNTTVVNQSLESAMSSQSTNLSRPKKQPKLAQATKPLESSDTLFSLPQHNNILDHLLKISSSTTSSVMAKFSNPGISISVQESGTLLNPGIGNSSFETSQLGLVSNSSNNISSTNGITGTTLN